MNPLTLYRKLVDSHTVVDLDEQNVLLFCDLHLMNEYTSPQAFAGFGEIFYSNAMNNGLLAVMLPPADVLSLMEEASRGADPVRVEIDVRASTVRSPRQTSSFMLSERHRRMFLEGLDMIGASLAHRADIAAFAQRHWARQPWVRDVARRTKERLDRKPS